MAHYDQQRQQPPAQEMPSIPSFDKQKQHESALFRTETPSSRPQYLKSENITIEGLDVDRDGLITLHGRTLWRERGRVTFELQEGSKITENQECSKRGFAVNTWGRRTSLVRLLNDQEE
jgi:hypothetical protein